MNIFAKRILSFVCLLAILVTAAPATYATAEENDAQTASTDWMAGLSDDAYLSEITIPGTHDSATAHIFPSFFLQCQKLEFAKQLEAGYRYLDIRVALDETDDGTNLKFIHNFGTCKEKSSFLQLFSNTLYLDAVLDDVYAFLDEHPTETVLFCVKREHGDDDPAVFETTFYDIIDQNPSYWYTQNEIPTLGGVRGKIVLATRFEDANNEGEDRTGLHFSWSEQNNKEPVADVQEIAPINADSTLYVQDRYKYGVSTKWDAIVETLENCQADEETFSLNFCSTSGSGYAGHPKKYARQINRQLLDYELKSGTCYGIINVDFADEKVARHIYSANF